MLYIFHVDTGTMRTFDMNLALESVSQLKEAIEKAFRIPVEKQVLLVSGGESLDPSARVCGYSAGTDTNPIFLFSKCAIESVTPPSPSVDHGSDTDLKEQVEASLGMPSTYNTVVVRAQLAQQFCELARDQTRICESLVHDQHLQQQGWAAVVANLEDTTAAFRSRTEIFHQSFKQHLESLDEYTELLQNYKQDLEMLSKIPLMPTLLAEGDKPGGGGKGRGDGGGEEGADDGGDPEGGGGEEEEEMVSLFQWISAKDNQSSLELLAEQCSRGLEQFDGRVVESLKDDMYSAIEAANKAEMKEIKGLEERLFGLEQLMFESRRIVQEQSDLAQAFLQNQNRAGNLGDPSILPDLCASHRRQLLVMQHNQLQLRDIRRRCTRAKEELGTNLYHRLRWVTYVENRIYEVDNRLVIYHESLKRLRRQLEVVRQIHLAPQMYARAVGEVVRRRTFSRSFLSWSGDLACQLLAVHSEEVARRQEFQRQFDGHFLNTLFPGLEDLPPAFATQAPPPFDSALPPLGLEDVERLRRELPELDVSLSVPDLGALSQYFLVKSGSGTLKTEDKEETPLADRLIKVVAEACSTADLDRELLRPSLDDLIHHGGSPSPVSVQEPSASREPDRGFESETDTEEFEKVGQSPVEPRRAGAGGTGEEEEMEDGGGAPGEEEEVAGLEVGVPSPSQSHPFPRQEFATTDFYIDESMPSSFTESNSLRCQRQSPGEARRRLEDVSALVALLQENLGNTRNEVERLRGFLRSAGVLLAAEASTLREDLLSLRALASAEGLRELVSSVARELAETLAARELQLAEERRREEEARDEEMGRLAKALEELTGEAESLRREDELRRTATEEATGEALRLAARLDEAERRCEELRLKVEACEEDKRRALKDLADRLTQDYKADLEGLRSRFRLMTVMERSPSDSSLERIERSEVTEAANHEQLVAQIKKSLQAEGKEAVKKAVKEERERWEAELEEALKLGRTSSDSEGRVCLPDLILRELAERDRLVEDLRARERLLAEECQRHQETIRKLAEDTDSYATRSLDARDGATVWPLLDRVEALETEKAQLQRELCKERARKSRTLSETLLPEQQDADRQMAAAAASAVSEMSASVAVVQDVKKSRDVATSPERVLKDKLIQSATLTQQGRISLVSCNARDVVLVVWNEEYQNYVILQESPTLYFLHSEYVEALGLKPKSEGAQRRLYSTGEVVDKEYCVAKKSENRFRVPVGTKFYRVRVRPLPSQQQPQHRGSHHHQQQNHPQQQ